MSQLNQKQMILQPTNATIVKATLTSSNYLCNMLYSEEVQVALHQKKQKTKNKLFSFANRNASYPAVIFEKLKLIGDFVIYESQKGHQLLRE